MFIAQMPAYIVTNSSQLIHLLFKIMCSGHDITREFINHDSSAIDGLDGLSRLTGIPGSA